jgi:hypothetical protein
MRDLNDTLSKLREEASEVKGCYTEGRRGSNLRWPLFATFASLRRTRQRASPLQPPHAIRGHVHPGMSASKKLIEWTSGRQKAGRVRSAPRGRPLVVLHKLPCSQNRNWDRRRLWSGGGACVGHGPRRGRAEKATRSAQSLSRVDAARERRGTRFSGWPAALLRRWDSRSRCQRTEPQGDTP